MLIRQDLFDRILDAKVKKTKHFTEVVDHFEKKRNKKNQPTEKLQVVFERCIIFFGEFEKFSVHKEYKYTPQWVFGEFEKISVHKEYKYTPQCIFAERTLRLYENFSLTLHGRLWIQVHSQFVPLYQNPKVLEETVDFLIQKMSGNPNIYPFSTAAHQKNKEHQHL